MLPIQSNERMLTLIFGLAMAALAIRIVILAIS